MPSGPHSDISSFLAVAQDRSFTKAAARLGMTPSALSHAVRNLEERLGLRLLNRTTRNVAPTEAGARLIQSVGPLFEQIDIELDNLGDLRERPGGKVRITCNDYVIETIFRPKLQRFLDQYPEIEVEFSIDYGFTDIIEDSFDAGVRLGDAVSKDMIAMRIGPDFRFLVVGAPSYFDRHPRPETPHDLTRLPCINLRSMTAGSFFPWAFEKDGKEINVRVEGQLAFNSVLPILKSAIEGAGLAYLPEDLAAPHLTSGALITVLEDWCPYGPGYHLYYPNSRLAARSFSAFREAMRFRG
ncbi:DNA-binding transcriptional regulator, LysR family [Paracoccus halophilus]|uniref:DNA-binding transcriptional regulator, LysR family n=1 Tax=Paracoccus halophilus TaxID=376733 RepID=A0A099EV85_9RHOB|nr:LysR family transcriptional regulator [Paracoccus halophilus]KGJ02159.1 LysR family transcriptional regulator [Paracoccus halophilus]SFA62288.1 DNA-binding transcriptional regulator, LysR family [Paracoccus halophilus]